MTITTTTNIIKYAGNGTTTVFSYTFKVFDDDDLEVTLVSSTGVETLQVKTTDYFVSGVGNDAGGNVTMVTAPATGESLVIRRNMPLTQETSYNPGDPFPAASHEDALDRRTMESQEFNEIFNRVVTAPKQDLNIGELPNATTRASKLFGFDSSGDPETDSANLIDAATIKTVEGQSSDITTLVNNVDDIVNLVGQLDDITTLTNDVEALDQLANDQPELADLASKNDEINQLLADVEALDQLVNDQPELTDLASKNDEINQLLANGISDGTVITGISRVNLLANLKALDTNSFTIAQTLGHTVIGEGAGLYYFDSSSVATANDGNIVMPDSGTGRWILVPTNGYYLVTQFGVRGDADSAVPLQTCIDAVGRIYGIAVPGVNARYQIEQTVNITNFFGFHFFGLSNIDKISFRWTGPASPPDNAMFRFTNCRQITMSNMRLEAGASYTGVNNAPVGILVESNGGAPSTQNRFDNIVMLGFRAQAIEFSTAMDNQQNDITTLYNCFWTLNNQHMQISGASTFFFNVIGGNFAEWDGPTGINCITGFSLQILNGFFTVGGTPGGSSIGPCITKGTQFGQINVDNTQLEGNCTWFNSLTDVGIGAGNTSSVMFKNCLIGSTAGGANDIVVHRQRGPIFFIGGKFGGGYGTHTIRIETPGGSGDNIGGLILNLGVGEENITWVTSVAAFKCGWDLTGEFYSAKQLGNVIGGDEDDALAGVCLTVLSDKTTNDSLGRTLSLRSGATASPGGPAHTAFTHQTTSAVGTTAKNIVQVISRGCIAFVHGLDTDSQTFCDIVITGGDTGVTPVVVSSGNTSGTAAAARTYTNNSGFLQLTMASGTYNINCFAMQISRVLGI